MTMSRPRNGTQGLKAGSDWRRQRGPGRAALPRDYRGCRSSRRDSGFWWRKIAFGSVEISRSRAA